MKRAKPTKPRLQRDKLIALVTKEVRRLERKGDADAIFRLLIDGLMWISNTSRTVDEQASAAIALTPIADDQELVHAALLSIWSRSGCKRPPDSRIRRTLEPLGVKFAPCGCVAFWAGDDCCGNAVEKKRAA